jgi:hypothetical protein
MVTLGWFNPFGPTRYFTQDRQPRILVSPFASFFFHSRRRILGLQLTRRQSLLGDSLLLLMGTSLHFGFNTSSLPFRH